MFGSTILLREGRDAWNRPEYFVCLPQKVIRVDRATYEALTAGGTALTEKFVISQLAKSMMK